MKNQIKPVVLVSGSSGYVGSAVVEKLSHCFEVIGIDLLPGETTEFVVGLESPKLGVLLSGYINRDLIIINCASAKDDIGILASEYRYQNVQVHAAFLKTLNAFQISHFIQISSVAALDGSSIIYSDSLGCDDAYRATKSMQEDLVVEWCARRNIDYSILLPSAVFGVRKNQNNIDVLLSIAAKLSFVPSIPVYKSLTYLPHLVSFIDALSRGQGENKRFLCIEPKVLSVSEIMIASKASIKVVNIPFLKYILKSISHLLQFSIGRFYDVRLTPPRVKKLFTDTDYGHIDSDIDTDRYKSFCQKSTGDLIKGHSNQQ